MIFEIKIERKHLLYTVFLIAIVGGIGLGVAYNTNPIGDPGDPSIMGHSSDEIELIPVGTIVMWSGTIASIPSSWALCDGTGGTPDLTDRFILGTSTGEDPGVTGGSNTHSHAVNSHTHSIVSSGGSGLSTSGALQTRDRVGDWFSTYKGNYGIYHTHTIDVGTLSSGGSTPGTDSADNVPEYYKLAFIMKV